MIVFPHCKINLGLSVIAKRPDGYHNLETCFYPVPWRDVLEVIEGSTFHFEMTGINIPGEPESNLCVKAYRLLREDYKLPEVQIHLHKVIPTGAGLGGGSSDAAFMLRLLNQKFELGISGDNLVQYAARLGSDCAFFIYDSPMMGSGRGEILKPIAVSLAKKFIVVVKPAVHVSTADAFAGIVPRQADHNIEEVVSQMPVREWRHHLKNDFEETVFRKYPEIERVKAQLYGTGALYAAMSGSGSSVFGIFDHEVDMDFDGMTVWKQWL